MRRIMIALAATALCLTSTAVADTASAGTVTQGPLTIAAPNQSDKPGCNNYPMSYHVANAPTDGWILSVTATGPGSAFGSADDTDGSTGIVNLVLCDSLDRPGTYYLSAELTEFTDTGIPTYTADTTFVLSKARTSTSLAVSPTRSKTGGYVTFSGDTNYLRDGQWANLPYSTVTILYLIRGTTAWHTLAQFETNSTGNYANRYRFNFKTTVHYHARVEESAFSARSYSPNRDVTHL